MCEILYKDMVVQSFVLVNSDIVIHSCAIEVFPGFYEQIFWLCQCGFSVNNLELRPISTSNFWFQ